MKLVTLKVGWKDIRKRSANIDLMVVYGKLKWIYKLDDDEINKIIYDSGVDSELTVALPVYNSKKIAWMAIESLCSQINVDFNWELIVYEEIHSESVFPNLIYDYFE